MHLGKFLFLIAVLVLLFIPLLFLIPRETAVSPEDWETGEYSLSNAIKVLRAIDKAESEQEKGESEILREVELTESELNDYFAYRIDVEQQDVMRELRLKLFKKNRIEGKIFIDLRGQDLPKILRPEMTLYFKCKLQIKQKKVRFSLKSLYLENQSVQPAVLDLIIFIASKITGVEPWSIGDWFDLPYGIKDIKTYDKRVVFFY